ncbi:MAG: hypothetical protein ABIJ56_18910 [Pseudomonadota bacterium]
MSSIIERRDEFLYDLDETERRPYIIPMEGAIAAIDTATVPINLPGKFNVWVKKLKGFIGRVPGGPPDVELVNSTHITLQLTSKPHGINLFEEPITFANLFGTGDLSEIVSLDPAWRLQPDGAITASFVTDGTWPQAETHFGICLICEIHDPTQIRKQKGSK